MNQPLSGVLSTCLVAELMGSDCGSIWSVNLFPESNQLTAAVAGTLLDANSSDNAIK